MAKKLALVFGTLIALGLTAGIGLAATQSYSTAKSPEAKAEFNFRVTLTPVPGTVKAVSAKINFDPRNLSAINGIVEVDLNKLETGIGLRDQHAKDALGAEKFPKAIFKIKSLKGLKTLEANKDYKATAIGDFTLKGVTKALEAPIELKFDGKNVDVSTAFDVLIADHKIEIPGADPKVDVKVNFTLEPGNEITVPLESTRVCSDHHKSARNPSPYFFLFKEITMKNLKIAAAVLSIALAIAAPSASSVFAQAMPAIVVATGETLVSSGNFFEIHAPTTGSVAIVKLADGKQVLRISGLKTEVAPDLKVWLHEKADIKTDDEAGLKKGKYLELGKLKAPFKGDSEYALPANVDLKQWKSAVIWCDQFSVAFGVTTLK